MSATQTTRTHYFNVSVMDVTKSFWTMAAALHDLRVRSARCTYRFGRICTGDIYAYSVATGTPELGTDDFGRAVAFYDNGKVEIQVPAENAAFDAPWVVLP